MAWHHVLLWLWLVLAWVGGGFALRAQGTDAFSPLVSYVFHDSRDTPDAYSPLVSYVFEDTFDTPEAYSPLVSYLYPDTLPGDLATTRSSATVSYAFGWDLPAPAAFQKLRVEGPSSVRAGETAAYRCFAQRSGGGELEITDAAEWLVVSAGGAPATYFEGSRLRAGAITGPQPVVITARYRDAAVSLAAAAVEVAVLPRLQASIVAQPAQTAATPNRMQLGVSVSGAGGPLTYQWNFSGGTPATANTAQVLVDFPAAGTYAVSVTVSDGTQTATARRRITVSALPVANEPTVDPAPDPQPGAVRDPEQPDKALVIGDAWRARAGKGLVVITHGLRSAATAGWLTNMAARMRGFMKDDCPNIAIWDWQEEADPVHAWDQLKARYADLAEAGQASLAQQLDRVAVNMVDFAADVLAIRLVAPAQGTQLADWIERQIAAGNVDRSAPIHLIGHSAGGFVMGRCGMDLGKQAPQQQVTMLDTPCPFRSHVKDYQEYGRVERYVTSLAGRLTLDFTTPGGGAFGEPGDINLGCTAVGKVCGFSVCGFLCNRLASVRTSDRYLRLAVHSSVLDEHLVVPAHKVAYEWYTETIWPGSEAGFAYSPWGGKTFPALADVSLAGEGEAAEPVAVPLMGFEIFGEVAALNGTYAISEGKNAGIFRTVALPVGVESLRFSYRFAAGGDGDLLSVHWGTNIVLGTGIDVELTRARLLEAELPIGDFAGQTNVLTLMLASRGQSNARLEVADIRLMVNPDVDADGLSNEREAELGTDPHRSDTDGDGIDDGEEIDSLQTNPTLPDTDNDGVSDADEIVAGTSPVDQHSKLGVSLMGDGQGGWQLEWPGATNKLYRVNLTTELPPTRTVTLVDELPAGLPKTLFKLPAATNVAQFYWIEVK